jgi:hypothetical protein
MRSFITYRPALHLTLLKLLNQGEWEGSDVQNSEGDKYMYSFGSKRSKIPGPLVSLYFIVDGRIILK